MYRYTNKGNGIITLSDGASQYTLKPGDTVSISSLIHAEAYGIVRENEQIKIPEERPARKTTRRVKEDDSTDD